MVPVPLRVALSLLSMFFKLFWVQVDVPVYLVRFLSRRLTVIDKNPDQRLEGMERRVASSTEEDSQPFCPLVCQCDGEGRESVQVLSRVRCVVTALLFNSSSGPFWHRLSFGQPASSIA